MVRLTMQIHETGLQKIRVDQLIPNIRDCLKVHFGMKPGKSPFARNQPLFRGSSDQPGQWLNLVDATKKESDISNLQMAHNLFLGRSKYLKLLLGILFKWIHSHSEMHGDK